MIPIIAYLKSMVIVKTKKKDIKTAHTYSGSSNIASYISSLPQKVREYLVEGVQIYKFEAK